MSDITKRQAAYVAAVECGLEGIAAVSFGICACEQCASDWDYCCKHSLRAALESDDPPEDEGGFSHSACGVCGCGLGGTRYVWHWLDEGNVLMHEDDGCSDCLVYLSNGELPDNEYLKWLDKSEVENE